MSYRCLIGFILDDLFREDGVDLGALLGRVAKPAELMVCDLTLVVLRAPNTMKHIGLYI